MMMMNNYKLLLLVFGLSSLAAATPLYPIGASVKYKKYFVLDRNKWLPVKSPSELKGTVKSIDVSGDQHWYSIKPDGYHHHETVTCVERDMELVPRYTELGPEVHVVHPGTCDRIPCNYVLPKECSRLNPIKLQKDNNDRYFAICLYVDKKTGKIRYDLEWDKKQSPKKWRKGGNGNMYTWYRGSKYEQLETGSKRIRDIYNADLSMNNLILTITPKGEYAKKKDSDIKTYKISGTNISTLWATIEEIKTRMKEQAATLVEKTEKCVIKEQIGFENPKGFRGFEYKQLYSKKLKELAHRPSKQLLIKQSVNLTLRKNWEMFLPEAYKKAVLWSRRRLGAMNVPQAALRAAERKRFMRRRLTARLQRS